MTAAQPDYLIVARIVAPFGIRGEVKAELMTDFPDRLAGRSTALLGRENETPRSFAIRGFRFHQGFALMTFDGCNDRTTAEALRGMFVQVPVAEAPPLPDGSYFFYQIIGLRVWGTDGREYGTITDVMTTPGNDVYKVDGERGEILVPAVAAFVRQVDLDHGRMIVEMSGLC